MSGAGSDKRGCGSFVRKFCESEESSIAWGAIIRMPDKEWNMVSEIVAKEILEIIRPLIKG